MIELIEPESLPVEPDGLTEGGRSVWLDLVPHCAGQLATARDSMLLGQLANLVAACNAAWASGTAPPATFLSELRRLSRAVRPRGPALEDRRVACRTARAQSIHAERPAAAGGAIRRRGRGMIPALIGLRAAIDHALAALEPLGPVLAAWAEPAPAEAAGPECGATFVRFCTPRGLHI